MDDKKALTITEQLKQLQQRGLHIENKTLAKQYLANISYYRLGEYWYVMQYDKEKHLFKQNSRFLDVIALYEFDSELRLLLFGAIEKIEIALRTKLIYHLSHEVDPFWFTQKKCFLNESYFNDTYNTLKNEVRRAQKKDGILKKHYKKYGSKTMPPAWKTIEHTSLGNLSKIYANLHHKLQSKDTIAQEFGAVNHRFLPSWLQSITQIRNFCAHHARLWNRNIPGTVKLLPKPPNPWILEKQHIPTPKEFHKLYVHLCLLQYMLYAIAPEHTFSRDLQTLLKRYPSVDPNALGIKPSWEQEPLWKS